MKAPIGIPSLDCARAGGTFIIMAVGEMTAWKSISQHVLAVLMRLLDFMISTEFGHFTSFKSRKWLLSSTCN